MPEQRVSDERLAALNGGGRVHPFETYDLALDLRDARNEIAQVEPVVRAAVKWRLGDNPDFGRVHLDHFIVDAVDALPESVRKEYGGG